jgi:hypothetical protein
MVRENLALAMAQWAGTKKGLITKDHLPTGRAFVPTHDGRLAEVFNPLELTGTLDLVRCVSNQVRGAVTFSSMLAHRVLRQTFGDPLRDGFDPNLAAACCAVHLLSNAMGRNMLDPVWDCPKGYGRRFEVSPISFALDASHLDGRPVFWEHFGGLEKYLELLEYCAQQLERPEAHLPPAKAETVEVGSNGSARPVAAPNGDSAVEVFLEASCVVDPEAYAIAGELYGQYLAWCRETDQPALAQRSFGITLTKLGFVRKRRGRGRHWWKGLEPAKAQVG